MGLLLSPELKPWVMGRWEGRNDSLRFIIYSCGAFTTREEGIKYLSTCTNRIPGSVIAKLEDISMGMGGKIPQRMCETSGCSNLFYTIVGFVHCPDCFSKQTEDFILEQRRLRPVPGI